MARLLSPGKVTKAMWEASSGVEPTEKLDELTGIGNRQAFDERLAIEWRRQRSNGHPLSVLICDVDLFKYYNDFYGYAAGDVCLRRIARAFKDCFRRSTEFAGRYGGETFVAILPDSDLQAARERAEALREKVRALAIDHAALGFGADMHVTVSVGVASLVPDRAANSMTLVEAAGTALRYAKRSGRNCIEGLAADRGR